MAEVVAAGKARAIGMSEATVEQLERAHAIHPVASVQSELSIWTRDRLGDVLPWCREHDVAFIPFAPLGRGYLTGTITAASFDDRDFRARNPRFTREALQANLAIVERVRGGRRAARRDAGAGRARLGARAGRARRPDPGDDEGRARRGERGRGVRLARRRRAGGARLGAGDGRRALLSVRLGIQLPEVERDVRWPEYLAMARAAEAAGFDSIWRRRPPALSRRRPAGARAVGGVDAAVGARGGDRARAARAARRVRRVPPARADREDGRDDRRGERRALRARARRGLERGGVRARSGSRTTAASRASRRRSRSCAGCSRASA